MMISMGRFKRRSAAVNLVAIDITRGSVDRIVGPSGAFLYEDETRIRREKYEGKVFLL